MQDEIGEEIPAFADFPQFLLEMFFTVGISRTNNINVHVSPSVYITLETLNARLSEYQKMRYGKMKFFDRDPDKPDYSEGGDENTGGTDSNVTLKVKKYTGLANVSLMIDDDKYDAENVVQNTKKAKNGDIILS